MGLCGGSRRAFHIMPAMPHHSTSHFAGTALAAFGTADSGVPATVIAPSLLFDDMEVHGARGEPQRLPLVPPPPMN